MGTILKRIKSIADLEGLSITALESTIGASKGVLSRALLNGTDIQTKWIVAIFEKFPHYSASWLLTGHKPMLSVQNNSAVANPSTQTDSSEKELKALEDLVEALKLTIATQMDAIDALKTNVQLLEKSPKVREGSKKAVKVAPLEMPSLF